MRRPVNMAGRAELLYLCKNLNGMRLKKIFLFFIASIACHLLSAQTYTVPFSGNNSITTCGGTVYDHRGTLYYSNYADGTLTIYPGTTGSHISLSFLSFSLESCC